MYVLKDSATSDDILLLLRNIMLRVKSIIFFQLKSYVNVTSVEKRFIPFLIYEIVRFSVILIKFSYRRNSSYQVSRNYDKEILLTRKVITN